MDTHCLHSYSQLPKIESCEIRSGVFDSRGPTYTGGTHVGLLRAGTSHMLALYYPLHPPYTATTSTLPFFPYALFSSQPFGWGWLEGEVLCCFRRFVIHLQR